MHITFIKGSVVMTNGHSELRRFVSLLSIVWCVVSIWQCSLNQVDYMLIMSLLTNYANIDGLPLRKEYQSQKWEMYHTLVKYTAWVFGIIYCIDCWTHFIFYLGPYARFVCSLASAFIGVIYFVLQCACDSKDSFEKTAEKMADKVETLLQALNSINEIGFENIITNFNIDENDMSVVPNVKKAQSHCSSEEHSD